MCIHSLAYPVLSLRIRAYVIDLLVLSFLVYFAAFIISFLDGFSSFFKGSVFVAVLVLFEPILIKFTGGSLGHHYVGIRIVDAKTHENLGLFKGVLRVFFKFIGGLISFCGLLISRQHRAIHDTFSGSVVLFKNIETVPSWRKFQTRQSYSNDEKSPLKRRLLVFVCYGVIVYLVLNWAMYLLLSSSCIFHNVCDDADGIKAVVIFCVITLSLILLLVLSLKGKLYGTNYK